MKPKELHDPEGFPDGPSASPGSTFLRHPESIACFLFFYTMFDKNQ